MQLHSGQTTDVLGDEYQDCIAAESNLYDTHFAELHEYGMHVEPNGWVSWYLDDVLLLNTTHEALGAKTNPYNASESVGSRTGLTPSAPQPLPTRPLFIE